MSTRFSLGIDLGTTNSAIALTDLETDQTEVLEVTQILGPNQIGEKVPAVPMMATAAAAISAAIKPYSIAVTPRLSLIIGALIEEVFSRLTAGGRRVRTLGPPL
jgi:molecular chaperone DnaK (HSP70)